MSLRRILAVIVVCSALLAVGLGTATGISLWAADTVIKRIQGANGQLEALHDLDGAVGRYGRQVMNQLLFGYDRPGEMQTARNDMQRNLNALARATREEFNVVSGPDELQGQLPELEQVRRITDLYFAVDKAATQAFALAQRGERDTAVELLARQVNFPLTNEIQPLIDRAIFDERKEIAERTRSFEALRNQFALWCSILAVLVVAAIIIAVTRSDRYLRRQIDMQTGRIGTAIRGESPTPAAAAGADFQPLANAVDELAGALVHERERHASAEARVRIFDTERSQFLADVGHQLRTPLTVLRGEADVALRGETTQQAMRESMERVRSQSAELALLLEDLLEALRRDADSSPPVMAQILLGDVVASAVGEGMVLAEPREVDIVVERSAGPIVVPGDFRRLKQALMIGIDNAVKHSPPGSTIRVGASGDDRTAIVQIADEGAGIADEDRPNLFRRFYRGRQENDLLNTGFGIGLSIAKQIVEQHGGTIAMRNRPEGGALFEIVLPRGGEAGR